MELCPRGEDSPARLGAVKQTPVRNGRETPQAFLTLVPLSALLEVTSTAENGPVLLTRPKD